MENISFQYPVWLLSACVAAGLIYALILYYKSKNLNEQSSWLKRVLSFMRFLTVMLASLLLLGPFIKSLEEEKKNPTIAILYDNSESVGNWLGKNADVDFENQRKSFESQLSEKYTVERYAFGNKIQPVEDDSLFFDQPITNLNQALRYISDIYEGENLGAVILATDGIYNDGRNPLYAKYRFQVPVFSVTLGDTSRQKDLIIKRIYHNDLAYLNDRVSVQVDIQSFNATGDFSRLYLEKLSDGRFTSLATEDIRIRQNDYFTSFQFTIDLNEIGVNHYRLRVDRLNAESNVSNNTKDFFIEVLDARQSILINAKSPHPDITALKQLLETNKNFDVKVTYDTPTSEELGNADLVIFHNLPAAGRPISNILSSLNNRRVSRVFIVGNQTDLNQFNESQPSVTILSQGRSTNEAQPVLTPDFNLFKLEDGIGQNLERFPPVLTPFGEYSLQGNVKTLLKQKIGSVETNYPLLSFVENAGIKTAYLFGEGIWRWKLFDYLEHENFELIGSLTSKSVIYTSTKEDKRKFRVTSLQNIYLENEDVEFRAELYNNSYELVNDPDVFLSIRDEDGRVFEFTFSKTDQTYALNTGRFKPGTFTYSAQTEYNEESLSSSGRFTVRAIQYELFDLEADYSVLYGLAQAYGGKVYTLGEWASLSDDLLEDERLKPVLYQNVTTRSLIDLRWIFGLLAILLCGEWFLRRYFGSL